MNAIIKQSRANLRKRKLQSVLTLITLTAAAALLTIALCTLNTAQGAYDRLFERINGAHLWLSLNLNLDAIEETEQLLADLTGVESTTGLMPIVYSDIFVGEKRLRNEELRPWPDDVTAPASPLIVEGNAPLAGETDTIVLDRNMAVLEGVAVGDTIRLLTPDGLVPLTVVGLSINAETCPYGNCFPVPHYLAPGALAALNLYNPSGRVLVTIGMRLIEPTKWESVLQAAKNALPANVLRGWKEWNGIRSGADASIESMRILLLIFCTVAVLSAGFLIANAITGAVMAQTRQIGLLKAIGFTRFQLGLTYLAEYVGFGLLASLLGLAAGVPASMLILRELAGKFGEEMLLPPVWVFLVVPLSILALTTIFTMLPVQRSAS